jgi:hypothetical protein
MADTGAADVSDARPVRVEHVLEYLDSDLSFFGRSDFDFLDGQWLA